MSKPIQKQAEIIVISLSPDISIYNQSHSDSGLRSENSGVAE
jgi:hypothetical protein